jgi:SnoaL-like domain
VNRDDFAEWLNGFIRGWEDNDVELMMSLFTEHAVFWESPFEIQTRGAEALRKDFERTPTLQIERTMDAEILGVAPEYGVACWRASYRRPDSGILRDNHGVMLVRFSTSGRCHEILEWQCKRDRPDS